MAQDVVVEAVLGENVGGQIGVVVEPVVRKLLGAQDQHRPIAQLVIFDHRQRGEGFAKADAVGQNAAVVRFQLVDDPGGGVALEVEQLVPDEAVLDTRSDRWAERLVRRPPGTR